MECSSNQRILEDIPLTSDTAEAFNRHFNHKFDQCHPGVTSFVDKLKINVENDIEYRLANLNSISNTKYKAKIENMKVICEKYHTYSSTTYLQMLAKLYSWKFE